MIFYDRHGNADWAMSDAAAGADYISRLEDRLSLDTGRAAVALCSADAALHTALRLAGVRRGDTVFVPTFTFYQKISTAVNIGAAPVFIDCDPTTRCVSATALEAAFVWAELAGRLPRAVVVDDAFGSVADYDVLLPLCKAYGASVIELATDAQGGAYKGTPCGANGDYGVVGLDKRVGGGGAALMLASDEAGLAREFSRARYSPGETHDYRMHNVIAALNCAMLDVFKRMSARAKANLAALAASDVIVRPVAGDAAAYALCRGANAAALRRAGYDVKQPPPAHTLPQYASRPMFEHEQGFCVASTFSDCCLVSMDMSAAKRRRLTGLLRAAA